MYSSASVIKDPHTDEIEHTECLAVLDLDPLLHFLENLNRPSVLWNCL